MASLENELVNDILAPIQSSLKPVKTLMYLCNMATYDV